MAKIRIAFLITLAALLAWQAHSPAPVAVPSAPRESVKTAPPVSAVKIPAVEARPAEKAAIWSPFRASVRELEATDQEGLERLYKDAAERIHADEPRALRGIAEEYPSLLDADLKESFFIVNSWMRTSHAPAALLRVIWSQAPTAPEPASGHHGELTRGERQRRIEAHALRELRNLAAVGRLELATAERTSLITELTARAGQTPSLNVGLEAFQLLSALDARTAIATALNARSANERELIAQVLDSNT